MAGTHLTTYGSFNLHAPALPPRSHLYHLTPLGIGTAAVESLTGYMMRLAHAHSVSTRTLLTQYLFPRYGRPYCVCIPFGASGTNRRAP